MGLDALIAELKAEYNTVVTTRDKLADVVTFFNEAVIHPNDVSEPIQAGEYYSQAMGNLRGLKPQTFRDANGFYVPHAADLPPLPPYFSDADLSLFQYDSLFMEGRYCFPVYDVRGRVAGLVGYDKFTTPKYLDSKNNGYLSKNATLYGMERLGEYYKSNRPVYIVEGIMCCLFIRQLGFQSLALLGSNITMYNTLVLNRLKDRAVVIPDSDEAGSSLVKLAKKKLPECRIYQPYLAKDVDDSRQVNLDAVVDDFNSDLLMGTAFRRMH